MKLVFIEGWLFQNNFFDLLILNSVVSIKDLKGDLLRGIGNL